MDPLIENQTYMPLYIVSYEHICLEYKTLLHDGVSFCVTTCLWALVNTIQNLNLEAHHIAFENLYINKSLNKKTSSFLRLGDTLLARKASFTALCLLNM